MLQLLLLSAFQGYSNGCQSFAFYYEEMASDKIHLMEKTYFCLKYMQNIIFPIFYGQIVIFGARSAFFLHSFDKEKHKFSFWRFISTFCIQAELNVILSHRMCVPACCGGIAHRKACSCFQIVSKHRSFMVRVTD